MKGSNGYIIVDLETTGFSPQNDRAVEIAAIQLSPSFQLERWWTTLLDPQQDVGPTRIHGITLEDVANAPTFSYVAPTIYEDLKNRTLIAHNAKFDISFLEAELQRSGLPFRVANMFCTMEYARRLAFKPATLEACCARYDIINPAPHSAIGDAVSTMQLFILMTQSKAYSDIISAASCPSLDLSSFALSEDWQNALVPRCPWL